MPAKLDSLINQELKDSQAEQLNLAMRIAQIDNEDVPMLKALRKSYHAEAHCEDVLKRILNEWRKEE